MPQGLGTYRPGDKIQFRGPDYKGYVEGSQGRVQVFGRTPTGTSTRWQPGPSYQVAPPAQQTGSAPVVTDRAGTGTYTGPDGSAMQGRSRNALNRMQGYGNQLAGLAGQAQNMYSSVYAPGVRQAYQTANMPVQDIVDRASIDTGLAFNKSQGILNRNMSRMGINPNSGRFQGLQQQWGLARAAEEAGAMTRARRQGQEDNFRRLLSAVGLAGNSFGQAAGALGSAAGLAGNAAGRYDQWATEEGAASGYNSPLQQEIEQDLGAIRPGRR